MVMKQDLGHHHIKIKKYRFSLPTRIIRIIPNKLRIVPMYAFSSDLQFVVHIWHAQKPYRCNEQDHDPMRVVIAPTKFNIP